MSLMLKGHLLDVLQDGTLEQQLLSFLIEKEQAHELAC